MSVKSRKANYLALDTTDQNLLPDAADKSDSLLYCQSFLISIIIDGEKKQQRAMGGERKGFGRPSTAATLGRRPQRGMQSINNFFAVPNITVNRLQQQDIEEDMGNSNATHVDTTNDDGNPTVHDEAELTKEDSKEDKDSSNSEGEEVTSPETPKPKKKQKFSGLLREAIDHIDQQKATNDVKRGILWKRCNKDYLFSGSIPQNQLCNSWKEFYAYDVFTWRPDVMHPGWKPKCISCGLDEKVGVNSYNREPRLVYGMKKNYLLNSPVQWCCLGCQVANASSETHVQYTFSSHYPHVLEQLRVELPGVWSLFPCEISWRSAIDNELLELLLAAADSGMGPSSVQGFVKC
jgi:hypothetical protein